MTAGPAESVPRADLVGWAPISPLQRGIWWEHQLAPDALAYSLCGTARLRGAVDAPALQASLDAIVARHAILRTTFAVRDGEPTQVVHPPLPADLTVIDLAGLPPPDRLAEAEARCAAEARRPFDPARLPLWRTTLIRLAADDALLVFARHHLVCDGRSMTVWFEELDQGYAAARHGARPRLAPLPLQYADAARRQHDWMSGPAARAQVDRWRGALAGLPSGLPLPPDFSRPPARGSAGASERAALPPHVLRRLATAAQVQGATPFMALLAAFMLMVHRYGGSDDVAVRIPVDARGEAAFEPLIGFFVNAVVIRTRLAPRLSFAAWLGQVRDAVLFAQSNAGVPYPEVVAALAGHGAAERPLEVPVEFAYQAWPEEPTRLFGLDAALSTVETGGVRATLAFIVDQVGDGAWIRAEYRTDVFRPDTVRRLLRSFAAIAEQAASEPRTLLSAISTLAPEDRRAVLLDGNRTQRAGIPPSVPAWLAGAPGAPDAPALIVGGAASGETWTSAALARAVAAEAARLHAMGVGRGTPVAVCLPREPRLIVALWAVVDRGAAFVPLDPEAPVARRRAMLADCGARVLFAEPGAAAWAGSAAVVLTPGDGLPAPAPPDPPPVRPEPDDAAYVMYTSGSTGQPKGVVITQRGLCNRLRWMIDTFAFQAADRVIQKTPATFDASVWEWMAPRLVGGCVVLAGPDDHRDPAALARTVRAHGVTVLQVVPSLLQALVEQPDLAACSSLRQVFCAGEVLPASLARRWRERMTAALCNTYGPTEAAIDVTAWPLGDDDDGRGVPIGRPIDNTRAYVLDAEKRPVPIGVTGDLFVAGAGLARGYHGRPALTAERFVPCPFGTPGERMYRTGDRARRRGDHALLFAGRGDAEVKLRGVRLDLEDLEQVLAAQPGVSRAAAAVVEIQGVPVLAACVVAGPDAVAALPGALAAILPATHQPARYLALAALPLTPHGKTDRLALARLAREAPAVQVTRLPPRDALDRQLARIWEEILGVPVDDCGAPFFALGGHSLQSVRLLARVERDLGLTASLAAFYAEPTIAGLRRHARPLPPVEPLASEPALSSAQRRLWFLHRWLPDDAAYNVAEAVRLTGPVDVPALRTAAGAIVRRHEVLRTRIMASAGEPCAILETGVEADPLDVVDLRQVEDGPRSGRAAEARAAAARRPFDLARTPLLRVLLIRLMERSSELLIVLPHLVSDEGSSAVLWEELGALYRAARLGAEPALPPPAQYRDFAAWDRAASRGTDGRAFWQARLADLPVTRLPSDRAGPAPQPMAGAALSAHVPPDRHAALTRLSRREGATPFMLLLTAFKVLLHRFSGDTDLCVATVISQRHRPEWDRAVGMFLNTLLLRTDLSGDPPFLDALARVRTVALDAYAHQDVPFDRVVETLRRPRDHRHAPLCPVMFVHQHAAAPPPSFGDLEVAPLPIGNGGAKFDFSLIVTEHAGGLSVTAEYATALFEAGTVERLLGAYVHLLHAIAEAPEARLSRLPLYDPRERGRLVAVAAGPSRVEDDAAEDLVDRLDRAAAEHALSAAVVHGDHRISYGELAAWSNRLARRFRAIGIGPDTCVGLCMEPCIELIVAMLAVIKAGGAYLPLGPALPPARLRQALDAASATLVIVADAAPGPDALPPGIRCARLDEAFLDTRGLPATPVRLDRPARRLAYAILTSGSTGEPKLAAAEHRGLLNLLRWYQDFLACTAADRILLVTAPSFDLTQKNILCPLTVGATIHLPTGLRADAAAIARSIAAAGITLLNCTPTLLHEILDAALPDRFAQVRSLRTVLIGGEALSGARLRSWLTTPGVAAVVGNGYGPSECSDLVTCHAIDLAADGEPIPIGRAIPGTTVMVLDYHLEPVPDLAEGELWIGGIAVGRGYLGRPGASADKFRPDPFSREPGARMYATGDRARRRANGDLEFLGRVDRQVKLRGFRIELGEIEAALERHPGVRRALVERCDGDRLVAYIVAADPVPASTFRAHLARSLPDVMLPAAYVPLAAIPLTRSGKVDVRNLPPPSPDDWARENRFVAPATETEARLAAIWSSLLGIDAIGTGDDFFSIGGHSLLAVQLAARIDRAFGLDLGLHVLFERSTIARLADYLDAVLATARPSAMAGGALEEIRL